MSAAVLETRTRDLVIDVPEEQREEFGRRASDGLAEAFPEMSARTVLTHNQKVAGIVVGVVLAILAVPFPIYVGRGIATVITLIYGAAVGYRVRCFARGLRGSKVHHVDDDVARAVPDEDLPIYTVLVPAYKEPEVIGALLAHLDALEYPHARLDVLILLEADDDVTLAAVEAANPGSYVRVAVVPPAALTTKPRACNYGLEFARGSLVTIFDAEDEPDPLQLRKAAVVFGQVPEKVACLQARLGYSNADQNIVTKWFSTEYLTWFNHFLPGLAELGSPIPLGGTSNHVRIEVLREVGGWDPYNVTEDADLGLRLARDGYRVENLDSITYEEANSDFVNWVKQRSRWLKGYLLTWLVHMRHPVQLKRELGWRGFAGVNLFMGGTPILAALNPVVWGSTLAWFLFKPPIIEELFTGPIYYLALATWVLGNFAIIYMGLISIRETARPELLASTLLVPAYWVMMALAAVKGVIQLIRDPSYWEKTTHGLGTTAAAPTTLDTASPTTAPTPAAVPAPVARPEPVSVPEPAAVPAPVARPEPVSVPEPAAVPEPVARPEPISVPEPVTAPAPTPVPAPRRLPQPVRIPVSRPVRSPSPFPRLPVPVAARVPARELVAAGASTSARTSGDSALRSLRDVRVRPAYRGAPRSAGSDAINRLRQPANV